MVAVLDIGKTNKKCFVFDEDYQIVFEQSVQLPETTDEDGEACEDLPLLTLWALDALREVLNDARLNVRAVNFSAYGASFVCLGDDGQPLVPLYNYLKPFPPRLLERFFSDHGSAGKLSLETASPLLGSLNSGLQLYRLKHLKPNEFQQIKAALHLPQYFHWLVTKHPVSELTSIGCHTMLWDFARNAYHQWVEEEGILEKLAPLHPSAEVVETRLAGKQIVAGIGLHDSSAALVPYLRTFDEPFLLISTGTWSISLNPFNREPLTADELRQDCLCYLTFEGRPVKAARLFAGHEHDRALARIASEYGVLPDFFQRAGLTPSSSAEKAYLDFMRQLLEKQAVSTRLALGGTPVRRIFVDGGFSKNDIFMTLLAQAFPDKEVFAAEIPQASALGAALIIHTRWNPRPLPQNLITLKKYSSQPHIPKS